MIPFELIEPRSLAEALTLLDPDDVSVRAAGGCTALMLMMKAGVLQPTRLISLRHIEPRYAAIEATDDGVLIGAQATLAAIEHAPLVRAKLPVIATTLRTLANVRVRNVATLGGHLAHADPHMDLPPVLIALGAVAHIAGRGGTRTLAIADLISGYYETTLRADELIAAVEIPVHAARRAAYAKVTTRAADDWPTLGVAVVLDATTGVACDARIAISAATEKPLRLASAEAALNGKALDAANIATAAEVAAAEARPIGDTRGSSAYKRQLVRVFVRRALEHALATAS